MILNPKNDAIAMSKFMKNVRQYEQKTGKLPIIHLPELRSGKGLLLQGPPGNGKALDIKSTIFDDEFINLPLGEHRPKQRDAQSSINSFSIMNHPSDLDEGIRKRFSMQIRVEQFKKS